MNSHIQPRRGLLMALVFAASTIALFALSTGPAHAATCAAPAFPGSGSFTGLTATKTNCADASTLVLGYQACRTKLGPAGHCVTKVNGYACREIGTKTSTSLSANVTCVKTKTVKKKKKKKKTKYVVTFSYTQNL